MKVVLEEGLFAEHVLAQASFDLQAIFRFGLHMRHSIVLGFQATTSSLFSAWFEKLSAIEQDAVNAALRYGLQVDARSTLANAIVIQPVPEPQWNIHPPRVPPTVAADLLARPLELLVEDSVNDSAFLRATAVGPLGDSLEQLVSKQWIRFGHGGGLPGISRQIKSLKERPEARLRTWVIFDSDAIAPGLPGEASVELGDLCSAEAFPYHCLWRRTMENYLPPDFLLERFRGGQRESAARAFQRLEKPEQRHHYNMKKGFQDDQKRLEKGDPQVKERVDALFSDVPLDERVKLNHGFGADVGELFRAEYGRRPEGLTEGMLLQDGVGEEMEQLLDRIMEWV